MNAKHSRWSLKGGAPKPLKLAGATRHVVPACDRQLWKPVAKATTWHALFIILEGRKGGGL